MLIIYAFMLVAGLGLIALYGLPLVFPEGEDYVVTPRINWTEYVIGVVVMTILFAVIINPVGTNLARGNSLKFSEFWNGFEVAANHERTPCSRDGSCSHEYNCDPYTVTEIVTVMDADGKGSHTETRTHTEYHHCPYATEEWTFTVNTTLGNQMISANGFTDNPQEWRGGSGIPGDVFRGVPPFWQAAKDRVDRHDPGPVTAIKTYDNYILASQYSILKKWSSEIERYQAKNLLPDPASEITSYYYANKVYFEGLKPTNLRDWVFSVNQLNAALGMDRQGDLHFVAVNSKLVPDPDAYAQALFAHWQSPKLGRKAASKNTIIVVVGTDGKTIKWTRADTGMPLGNEQLLVDLRNNLKGTEFTPTAVFGHPIGTLKQDGDNYDVSLKHSNGVLDATLWGVHKFERVCMTCKDDEGKTGFTYLKGQIPLKTGQRVWIMVVSFIISLIVWVIMAAVDLKIPDVISINNPWRNRATE